MALSRRELLRGAAAAAGAGLLARPTGALADVLGGFGRPEDAASRTSRLFPGTRLAHADLHNHTLLSDGAGAADAAFASMRSAGLDVAALTDHATISQELPATLCGPIDAVLGDGDHPCQSVAGINEASWRRTGRLADAADEPGSYTAIRGFEWSSPTLGHMNVWFSGDWADPLHTGGLGSPEDLLRLARENGADLAVLLALEELIRESPAGGAGMRGWYRWLKTDASLTGLGGADGLAGFNHPGREPLRFSEFAFDADLVDRVVSLELFNRRDDYLFENTPDGRVSPLVACLDAGWRPGLAGVTDEHGTDWGFPDGKGRTGLWLAELSREGVREALLARRFFATRLRGLRLDAAARSDGDWVRMGAELAHDAGTVELAVDVDRGRVWWGRPLVLQMLRTGSPLPEVVAQFDVRVPGPDEPVIRRRVSVDAADGDWLVARLTDPARPADERATGAWATAGGAIAYASPWYLRPA